MFPNALIYFIARRLLPARFRPWLDNLNLFALAVLAIVLAAFGIYELGVWIVRHL